MRKIKFELTVGSTLGIEEPERTTKNEKSRSRVCYGMKMTVEDCGECYTVEFPDITYNKSELIRFIAMLERNDVSPVHVEEIIDDFFYSW